MRPLGPDVIALLAVDRVIGHQLDHHARRQQRDRLSHQRRRRQRPRREPRGGVKAVVVAPMAVEQRLDRDQCVADRPPAHGYNQPAHQDHEASKGRLGERDGDGDGDGSNQRLRRCRDDREHGVGSFH